MTARRPLAIVAGKASELPNGDQLPLDTLNLTSRFLIGLEPFWNSASSVGVRAGAAYIEGAGKIIATSADLTLTGLALTASAWSHLYVYNNAGVLALEVSSTAPVAYSGTARSKTGDNSRRYVGSVLTDASGNIYNFAYSDIDGAVKWENSIADAPFLVISLGRATTATNIACAGCVPVTAKTAIIIMATPGGTADAAIGNSAMTGALSSTNYLQYVGVGVQTTHFTALDSSQRFSYRMTATTSSSGFYARVCGYILER